MNKMMKSLCAASLLALMSSVVFAKLPLPSDEAKAKADEAKAKAAWSGKVNAYLNCKAQNKVVAHYVQSAQAAGQAVKAPTVMPACADPGAFSYAQAAGIAPAQKP